MSSDRFIVVAHFDRVARPDSFQIVPEHAKRPDTDVRIFGPDDLDRCRMFVEAAKEHAGEHGETPPDVFRG